MLYEFQGFRPQLARGVFVAPGACIIGRVTIKEGSSVWFNTVLRADINEINIGKFTNIQDNAVVHVDPGFPTVVGDFVLVGHRAILHGCTVADGALIGMGAVLLDGARVGEGALVAAGAVVREGDEVPAGTLAAGTPARVIRKLEAKEIDRIRQASRFYASLAGEYSKGLGEKY